MIILSLILIYLLSVNVIAYRAFAKDKAYAIRNEQRTPEAKLLFWAEIGGWIGAKIAQRRLRHKTNKQPFGRQLNNAGILQALVLASFAAVFGVLAGISPEITSRDVARAAVPAAQAVPPAGAPPGVSLRPPAVRPATY